jgi:signal transduction histidine kinase/CheY-like chemotaxis protein
MQILASRLGASGSRKAEEHEPSELAENVDFQADRLKLLAHIAALVPSRTTAREIWEACLDGISEVVNCDRAMFAALDEAGELAVAAQRGLQYHDPSRSIGYDDPPAVILRDDLDIYVGPAPPWFAEATGIQTTIAVAVRVNGRPVGSLNAGSRKTEAFDESDTELMRILAAQIGIAMEGDELTARERDDDRLRTLGQLSAGVTHDINNALSMLRMNLWLLPRYTDVAEKTAALVSMRRACDRIGATVRRIQEYAGTASLESPRLVDLGEAAREAVGMTASKWRNEAFELGKSIQVTANLSPEIYVLGSENAIIDAVANLIINAVDAIEHAGEIEISVRAAGDDAILQVSDNGVSMYEATRSRIFEPFYTTKESGHGLGLSIIEEAFRAMAGGIVVESAPGEGSTFTATFPRAEKAGRTAEMQEGRGATPRKSLAGLRVLVVDDEKSVRDSTLSYLELHGCRVEAAGSGEEALKNFVRGSYDFVICDIGMPGLSGWDVASRIRQIDPDCWIVMFTGYGSLTGMDRVKEVGAVAVVTKPDAEEELLRVLTSNPTAPSASPSEAKE